LLILGLACGFRAGDRVLIPDGYIGWARIYYQEAGTPSLPKEDGRYLIVIDGSGNAHTSTPQDTGYGIDEYFYVSSAGRRTKLKLQGVKAQKDDMIHDFTYERSPREVTMFFVGPRTAMKVKPRAGLLD
jgi:hypothetical protein